LVGGGGVDVAACLICNIRHGTAQHKLLSCTGAGWQKNDRVKYGSTELHMKQNRQYRQQ